MCRVQRASSSSGTAEPRSGIAHSPSPSVPDDPKEREHVDGLSDHAARVLPETNPTCREELAKFEKRFFIMKSLAVEDLLLSV